MNTDANGSQSVEETGDLQTFMMFLPVLTALHCLLFCSGLLCSTRCSTVPRNQKPSTDIHKEIGLKN